MKLEKLEMPVQNNVLHAYQQNEAFLHKYFDYRNEEKSYINRVKELKNRCFKRRELAEVIRTFMTPFGLSAAADRHLNELVEDVAVTIVGGQQAGVLTGPLYSVHKAITVILHAKQQRKMLGIPVIPVFWIAGEDHDINEINHIYSEVNGQVMKEQIQDKFVLKLMASETEFNREEMAIFVKRIFEKFGETSYTEALLTDVLDAVNKEKTFTGFFVRLMNGLFAEEGLLFIDAAFEPLRKLESEYFCKLIEASEEIAESVVDREQQLHFDGFGNPLDAQKDASHLFYVHETGRMLLSRQGEKFVNDSVGLEFTKEELIEIAMKQPALLSNNVASRPLMQELLLPVLAFVGGAGELAYWAVLRGAFHHLGLKMPIFIPRMSITLVSRQTEKVLRDLSLSVEDVMAGAATNEKIALLDKVRDDGFVEKVNGLQEKLVTEYEKLSESFAEEEMMNELLQKNMSHHLKQFNYLKHKYEDALYVKHEVALRKYDQLESELFPNGQFQERIYHPYVYLNQYGPSLVKDLLTLPFENDGAHYIVYL